MIRNLLSIFLAVVIALTSVCYPAYASTEASKQESGGFLEGTKVLLSFSYQFCLGSERKHKYTSYLIFLHVSS